MQILWSLFTYPLYVAFRMLSQYLLPFQSFSKIPTDFNNTESHFTHL